MNESLISKLAKIELALKVVQDKPATKPQVDYSKEIESLKSELTKANALIKEMTIASTDVEAIIKKVITRQFLINLSRNTN